MNRWLVRRAVMVLSLILGLFSSYTVSQPDAIYEKTGGYMKGVCHPGGDTGQIAAANINWARFDIPFPYNADGSISEGYKWFKARAAALQAEGIKVMAITPYPHSYIAYGLDPRVKDHEAGIKDIAVFMLEDLRGLIDGIQVTNEMGLPHFTMPLNLDEAVRFIGIQLEALNDIKGSVVTGYNSAGLHIDLHTKMLRYRKYYDYVGIDIYQGSFDAGIMEMHSLNMQLLYALVRKPIILQEFGYIGGGEPKPPEQKLEIIQGYGFASEQEARENVDVFIERLPALFRYHILTGHPNPEDWERAVFEEVAAMHLYRELPAYNVIPGYPHTPEGQAAFYTDVLPMLRELDFLAGVFIYCYADSDMCYFCGQHDCPVETKWGLVDSRGNEKPSYYAVQAAFAED